MAGTPAQDISPGRPIPTTRTLSVSTSPTATFHSSFGSLQLARTQTRVQAKELKPFDKADMKILLLENVNQSGQELLSGQNYQVESLKTSLPEDQLIERIRWVAQFQSCSHFGRYRVYTDPDYLKSLTGWDPNPFRKSWLISISIQSGSLKPFEQFGSLQHQGSLGYLANFHLQRRPCYWNSIKDQTQ